MKIIHAHKYYYPRAGAERYMLSSMQMQEHLGHHPIPFSMQYAKNIATPWSKYFVTELHTEGDQLAGPLRLAAHAFWSVEAKKNMKKLLKEVKPDVVHVHNLYTHLSPSILSACREAGVPVVLSVHDYALVSANYSLWDRGRPMDLERLGLLATANTRFIKGSFAATLALDLITKLQRRFGMYRHVDRFLANSQFTANLLMRARFRKEKIEVVYPFYDERIDSVKKKRSVGKDVVYVGRLVRYKGVHTLIDVMKRMPKTRLRIFGTGPEEANLKRLANGCENIVFEGFVKAPRLWEEVQKARMVVVPSLWYEAFGLSAVEAMALGVPVIVPDHGGISEIVEDGVSGVRFLAGDTRSMKDAIELLLHDSALCTSMGEAAKVRAREISGPNEHIEKLLSVYEEVARR